MRAWNVIGPTSTNLDEAGEATTAICDCDRGRPAAALTEYVRARASASLRTSLMAGCRYDSNALGYLAVAAYQVYTSPSGGVDVPFMMASKAYLSAWLCTASYFHLQMLSWSWL